MAPNRDRQPRPTRRRLLAAGGTVATGALLGATAPAAAQSGEFDGWFDDVDNYDGVVDRTGQSEVTVEVGVDNGGQPYGFGPPAVRIDPGATVVWEWTGDGGSHNVVAEDGSFESELVGEAGHTFSHTFEEEGVYKYVCIPHEALGMKGAIVVGDISGGGGEDEEEETPAEGETGGGGMIPVPSDFVGWFALVIGGSLGVAVTTVLGAESYAAYRDHATSEQAYVGEQSTEAVEQEPVEEIGGEYDPFGTAALVAGYFVLIALLWVFMYFVEFIGGPTITG